MKLQSCFSNCQGFPSLKGQSHPRVLIHGTPPLGGEDRKQPELSEIQLSRLTWDGGSSNWTSAGSERAEKDGEASRSELFKPRSASSRMYGKDSQEEIREIEQANKLYEAKLRGWRSEVELLRKRCPGFLHGMLGHRFGVTWKTRVSLF